MPRFQKIAPIRKFAVLDPHVWTLKIISVLIWMSFGIVIPLFPEWTPTSFSEKTVVGSNWNRRPRTSFQPDAGFVSWTVSLVVGFFARRIEAQSGHWFTGPGDVLPSGLIGDG